MRTILQYVISGSEHMKIGDLATQLLLQIPDCRCRHQDVADAVEGKDKDFLCVIHGDCKRSG
jgi:hypothetical protein